MFLVVLGTVVGEWMTPETLNVVVTKSKGDTTTTATLRSNLLPSKKDLVAIDSVTYFITGPSNSTVVLKQIRFVLNKKVLDTITIGTKAAGTTYKSVTVAYADSPKSVFYEQYQATFTLGAADSLRPYTGQVTANVIYNKK